MGYSDQKYFSYDLDKVATAIAFGTATASGTNTLATPAAVYLPKFQQNTVVLGAEVVAATAPNNKLTGNFQVLNGTNTIINVPFGTASAAGAVIYGSYTGTYTATGTATADKAGAVPANVVSSGSALTFQLNGTSTASADTTGTWDLYLNNSAHV